MREQLLKELSEFWTEIAKTRIPEDVGICADMIFNQLSRESRMAIANGEVDLSEIFQIIVQTYNDKNKPRREPSYNTNTINRPKFEVIRRTNAMCLGISLEQHKSIWKIGNQDWGDSQEDSELVARIAEQIFDVLDGKQASKIRIAGKFITHALLSKLPDEFSQKLDERVNNGTSWVFGNVDKLCEEFDKNKKLEGITINISGPVSTDSDGYDIIGVAEATITSQNRMNPNQRKESRIIVEVNPHKAYEIDLDDDNCPSGFEKLKDVYKDLKAVHGKKNIFGSKTQLNFGVKTVINAILEATRSGIIRIEDAVEQIQVISGILSGEISPNDPRNKMEIVFDLQEIKEAKWGEAGLSRSTVRKRKEEIKSMAEMLIELGVVDRASVNAPESYNLRSVFRQMFGQKKKGILQLPEPTTEVKTIEFRKNQELFRENDGTYSYKSPKNCGAREGDWKSEANGGTYSYKSAEQCSAEKNTWRTSTNAGNDEPEL